MSSKIVFFGNERLATGVSTTAPVLRALIEAGYDIRAVVTTQGDIGRSRKPRPLEIAAVAAEHNIPLIIPGKLSEQLDEIQALDAEAGVLVAFGKIVPQSLIDVFPRGIINIHPSALPKHRGPTPLESVLLAGESETAVSLMALGAEMDAGPVYAQQAVSLAPNVTKQQLADQLLETGRNMLISHLPAILNGSLNPEAQDDSQATYDTRIAKDAGVIVWQRPAVEIERQIRAYAGWPKSRANIGGHEVVLTAAHVVPGAGTPGVVWLEGRELGMHTGDGILIIDELVPAGKKPMSGSAFLLGYRPTV